MSGLLKELIVKKLSFVSMKQIKLQILKID